MQSVEPIPVDAECFREPAAEAPRPTFVSFVAGSDRDVNEFIAYYRAYLPTKKFVVLKGKAPEQAGHIVAGARGAPTIFIMDPELNPMRRYGERLLGRSIIVVLLGAPEFLSPNDDTPVLRQPAGVPLKNFAYKIGLESFFLKR